MLTHIHPKLPMRNKALTKAFYVTQLGFRECGDYGDYLIIEKDAIELHFFLFEALNPKENYGQVYIRTDNVAEWYRLASDKQLPIPALGHLQEKPWGQKEFALLDPDHNLLTFGEEMLEV
jgi:catechol 2,3-dioxygenase-like lactoylglutathione lyase family enzyme